MVFPDNHKLKGKPKGIKQMLTERNIWLEKDFCEQRSILEEAIIKAGYIFECYPKFHCECNFIERYWGFAKWETRRLCNYNYNDLLLQVLEVLISVSVTTIRKFACKS
ncbi:hypothetical protein RhiirC2_800796 [Rhizophagus irregularis]|uniref:Uncharacterized protein n=1 Tax=Rhizophagus irregularis TaxID=588596 RepID=A0A2N1M361_9GLOM|nr:hypothetical protein RhiirC2_800796 [Rhizophagus irregularis]